MKIPDIKSFPFRTSGRRLLSKTISDIRLRTWNVRTLNEISKFRISEENKNEESNFGCNRS